MDLSNASIRECDAIDPGFANLSSTTLRRENQMPEFSIFGLKHLTEIKLPSNIDNLADNCLTSADLTSVDIPIGVKSIGLNAFFDNPNLKIIICRNPDPVSVLECAFQGTKCLQTGVLFVPIGAKESYLNAPTWQDFPNIVESNNPDTSILSFESEGLKYKIKGDIACIVGYNPDVEFQNIVIPETIKYLDKTFPIKELAENAFNNIKANSISMSDCVEIVGEYCFYWADVKTIHLSDNIKHLPFCSLSSPYIQEINLPENLETIATAMPSMSGLKYIYIPAKVKRENASANFGYDFASLEYFSIDPKNEDMCVVDGVLFNKKMSKLLNYPGLKKGDYTVPDNVTEICNQAFSWCSNLTSLYMGESVKRIKNAAIWNCNSLEYISLSGDITVDDNAINYLPNLKSISVGDITFFNNPLGEVLPCLSDIYLTNTKPVKIDEILSSAGKFNIYHPEVSPTIESSLAHDLFIPGQTRDSFTLVSQGNNTEMWQYELGIDGYRVYIKPLIDGLIIDRVLINGKETTCFDYIYTPSSETSTLSSDQYNAIDVIVNYTLHEKQSMITHYTSVFNANIKPVDLDKLSSGINDIQVNDSQTVTDIYNLQGICIMKNATKQDIKVLPQGLYIMNGQKLLIK